MPEQRTRTVEILSKNEQKFNMQIISGVSHGFAVSLTTYTCGNIVLISFSDAQPSRRPECGMGIEASFRKLYWVV